MSARLALATVVRARRHPGLIASVFAAHLAIAAFAIWPLASMVRATYRAHPQGDRVLFSDGAVDLLDFLVRALPTSSATLAGHLVVFLPLAFAAHVVTFGATLATLGLELGGTLPARARSASARAIATAVRLFGQSLLTLFVQALCLFFAGLVFVGTSNALAARFGVPVADRVGVAAALPFVLAVFVSGMGRDIAGARVVVHDARALSALKAAFSALARKPSLFVEYSARSLVVLFALAVGGMIATRLGGRGGMPLFALFVIHQGVAGLRVALRVSWLAAALRKTR